MTKNIIVLDENDNMAGQTYPKRARGLVRSGRAEFVDEGTIRLVTQPSADYYDNERKDENMSEANNAQTIEKFENIKENSKVKNFNEKAKELEKKAEEAQAMVENSGVSEVEPEKKSLDINDLCWRVDQLMDNLSQRTDNLMSLLEKADSNEKISAVVNITNTLRDGVNNALEVYRIMAMGASDLSAAIESVSRDPQNANFAAGMMDEYRLIIEK